MITLGTALFMAGIWALIFFIAREVHEHTLKYSIYIASLSTLVIALVIVGSALIFTGLFAEALS